MRVRPASVRDTDQLRRSAGSGRAADVAAGYEGIDEAAHVGRIREHGLGEIDLLDGRELRDPREHEPLLGRQARLVRAEEAAEMGAQQPVGAMDPERERVLEVERAHGPTRSAS